MTPDERAFLNAIIAAPDDDVPRLVYADWLDEHDEPARAEFIRVECELPHLEPGHPRRSKLMARHDLLSKAYRQDWFRAFIDLGVNYQTSRGFVQEVTTGPEQLSDHAEEWFAMQPITCLRLTRVYVDYEGVRRWFHRQVFSATYLGRLKSLDLRSAYVNSAGVYFLSRNPSIRSLRELDLSHNHIDNAGAEKLAAMPELANLRSLNLSFNQLTDAGARALASSTTLTGLDNLWVARNRITSVGWDALQERFGPALVREAR